MPTFKSAFVLRRTIMFFDSHAHLNDERFDEDREELIASLNQNGISNVVNIGADLKTSRESIELAEKYDFIYASVGVHPHDVEEMTDADLDTLTNMSKHEKVVAIGEIGLDYYYDNSPRELQRKWFRAQMELANKLNLPVIIHSRDAMGDTLEILKECPVKAGVLHCYSGSIESAKEILKLGYYISFAGPVTFKNAKGLTEAAKYVPLDKILIETDCPYLAPEPYRGKRNSSLYVSEVAKKIAELKGITVEEVAKVTMENAKRVFEIK